MDEAAPPPFSEQREQFRARLEQALAELCAGVDPGAVLEALQEEAERDAHPGHLAWAYAELLRGDDLDALPRQARLEVCLQAAWLCGQQEELEAATLKAASLALDVSPADERALAIAEPLLLEAEQYGELADRYAMAAQNAGSDERARKLLERAVHMLAPLPAAMPAMVGLKERLQQLSGSAPSNESVLLAAANGPSSSGRYAALVELGERWLSAGTAREGIAQLELDLAAFDNDAALDVLERLFDQAEDASGLERTLRRRLELAQNALARGRWLEKLAAFHQDVQADKSRACDAFYAAAAAYGEADDVDEAERAYERLLDLDPDHTAAACALVRLRAAVGNFAGVVTTFADVLRTSDDSAAAMALLLAIYDDAARGGAAEEFAELADSVLWRLSETDRESAATLLRASARLYAATTRYDEAAELYRRLVAENGAREDLEAYQALIDAHPGGEWRQNQQRWLFEWQEHHTSDRPTLLLEWAQFEEQELGDPQAALGVLGRAAELAPDRPEVWQHLTRLRLAEGDGAGGLLAAGELRRLGQEVEPSLLGLLLEHEPAARWALDRVKLTLSAAQRWPELFALYDRAIDATDDAKTRAELLDEAAIAARDVAQDRARALSYWQRHTELIASDARVDTALERLYVQAGDTRGLIRHLRRRLGHAPSDVRPTLLRRIAALSLQAGELDDAVEAAEQLRPDDEREADELLEFVLTHSLEQRATGPGRRAARLLRARLGPDRSADVARLLRAELSFVEADERRTLLTELSRVCEKDLGDPDGAFDAEREIFLSSPGERERKRLEKLAKKAGRFKELCEAYVDAVPALPELEARQALLRRAAELAELKLKDRGQAMCLFRRMYEVRPEQACDDFDALRADRGEAPTAFEALCWLLEDTRRHAELGAVLERAVLRGRTPELLTRLARLQADWLQDPAAAIVTHLSADDSHAAAEVFLRGPSVFSEDPATVLELARRLSDAGEPEGAVRVLRHQLGSYEQRSPCERKRVQLELVQVLETTGALDAAAAELSEAALRYPTDIEVQRACAAVAARREDWERAEQGYRALLLLLHGSGNERPELCRAPVYVALADIKRQRRQDADAEELLESAFEAALANVTELAALMRCLLDHELWPPAERACVELLQMAADERTRAIALGGVARLLPHRPAPELAERATEAARSLAEHLSELPAGDERCGSLVACMALLPVRQAQELLREHAGELPPADRVRAELCLCERLLAPEHEDQLLAVAARLEQIVVHPEAPDAAWALLARAWQSAKQPEKVAGALASWLEREPRNAVALGSAVRNALERQDVEQALEFADRAKRANVELGIETTGELRKLCVRAGKLEPAVSFLVQEAAQEKQGIKRAALLLEAAELLRAAGEPVAALDLAREARALDSASADAVLLLAKLALEDGERDEALQLLAAHAESKERRRGKPLARLLRLAADLHLEQDELAEALPLLQEAHQLDKTDLDTALLLGLLAVDLDRLETAASALRVLVAQRELGHRDGAVARSRSIAQGYFHLARIEQHHGKKTNAKRMALRALEEDPSLAPAQRLLSEIGTS